MEGLISKKGEFKSKCDKPNTVLSQIWDKTKHGLRDWIISHLGPGIYGGGGEPTLSCLFLHFFKFLCGSSKKKEGKRSGKREEIKVWNSHIC